MVLLVVLRSKKIYLAENTLDKTQITKNSVSKCALFAANPKQEHFPKM